MRRNLEYVIIQINMSLLLSLCVLTCPGLFFSRHFSVFFFTVCIESAGAPNEDIVQNHLT